MKTRTVNIENLCAPCHCGCRHCLLSSQHKATGVEYRRGERLARRFYSWLSDNRPEIGGMYYIGYCMDFPELIDWIKFNKGYNPWFNFLQFNGLKFRAKEELHDLMRSIKAAGIQMIDLTFYGLQYYHDRFSGRGNDFEWMLTVLGVVLNEGIAVNGSICVTKENLDQLPELIRILKDHNLSQYILFLPHDKGRGEKLRHLRITSDDFKQLPEEIRAHFMKTPHKTQSQWINGGELPILSERNLTLSLTPDNIDMLEAMSPEEILRYLEDMDDQYYRATPDAHELSCMYADTDSQQLYRYRDLLLQWQKQYWQEHPRTVADMNDERYSFSIHV